MAISKVELLNDTGVTPGSYTFADLTIGSDGRITSASSNPSGGSIPVGGIIIWSGTIASIPSGWRLCDGSFGTPDLRDRFVVGSGNLYNPGDTGGSKDAVVVSHSHTVTPSGSSFARFVVDDSASPPEITIGNGTRYANLQNTVNTSTAGGSGVNQNLPPYYALAYIIRVS